MPTTPQGFARRLDELKAALIVQAHRVQALQEVAFESVFDRDIARAKQAEVLDDEIDRIDVEIEKAAVEFLTDATRESAALNADQLRGVLTAVKINNELERIADCAVDAAQWVQVIASMPTPIPDTFRVMANSTVGIMRDTSMAYERSDAALAKVVLQSQGCVEAFKHAILRDAESSVASGTMAVDFAFAMHEIANQCQKMADHCTNIAEQVIYSCTGAIVRHMIEGGTARWVEVPTPGR